MSQYYTIILIAKPDNVSQKTTCIYIYLSKYRCKKPKNFSKLSLAIYKRTMSFDPDTFIPEYKVGVISENKSM